MFWMIQNKTGQWWSPSDGWTSKMGAKVYGVTDRQSMGAEDMPEDGKWVPTNKTMKEAEEIQDIKRRAGITEQQMISVTSSDIQQVIDTLRDGDIGEAVAQLESMLGESPQQWADFDRRMGLIK